MSLGYDQEIRIVNKGDAAELIATIYDRHDDPFPAEELISVEFTVQAPDGTTTTVAGMIEEDGSGVVYYGDTYQVGHHVVMATFLTVNGAKSTRTDFEVIDPFASFDPSPSWILANDAWSKFEDCFDAEEEGPWLQDMTLNCFKKEKMERFIDDALMDINLQHPPTNLTLDAFIQPPTDTEGAIITADMPLITQALLVQLIRHLIRSYVEQPNPVGAQIAWHDRRDYLQRWQSVLQIEMEQYKRLLALYKRRYLGLGATVGLVSSKAGRLIPAPMRTRMAGRGYW